MENKNAAPVKKMYYPKDLLPGYKGLFLPANKGCRQMEDFSESSGAWTQSPSHYSPTPNYTTANKIINMDRMLSMPSLPLGQVDHGRRTQVDEFYLLCQMHRDQYRDRSGRLHPLDYFRSTDYKWQSPPDVTRTYLKHLPSYVKYYRPVVLAQTTARTVPPPPLPERSLAGRYYRLSDSRYKR